MRRDLTFEPARPEVLNERVPALSRQVSEKPPIDRHTGSVAAKREVFCVLESEQAVIGRAPWVYAEASAYVLEKLVRPGEHASDVRAHSHQVAADGLEVEHVVEARSATHFGRGQVEQLCNLLYALGAQVPLLFLDEMKERDQGRALERVQGDDRTRPARRCPG